MDFTDNNILSFSSLLTDTVTTPSCLKSLLNNDIHAAEHITAFDEFTPISRQQHNSFSAIPVNEWVNEVFSAADAQKDVDSLTEHLPTTPTRQLVFEGRNTNTTAAEDGGDVPGKMSM